METRIFKDKATFAKREDKTINGVSQEFANGNPDFVKDNELNTGCWECVACTDCTDCIDCVGCSNCNDCISCVSCSGCVLCGDCNFCNQCSESDYMDNCENCQACLHCDNSSGLILADGASDIYR